VDGAGGAMDGADGQDREAAGRRLAYVEREVRDQLVVRRRRRDWDRRRAFALQMATIGLSAAITVLLGLKVTGTVGDWLADLALAMGALVTVLAAWAAFFSHRALWIQRSDTVHRMEALKRRIEYYREGLGDALPLPAEVDDLRAELERIAQDDHDAWSRIRQLEAGA